MSCLVEDKKVLRIYYEMWSKIKKKYMKRGKLDSDPNFDKKYLRTKTKFYIKKITTNFQKCLKIIVLSQLKKDLSAFVCQR